MGTKLRVPTLEGSAKVKIPPGSQPGSVLRLAGKLALQDRTIKTSA